MLGPVTANIPRGLHETCDLRFAAVRNDGRARALRGIRGTQQALLRERHDSTRPATKEKASEARETTAFSTSSGWPMRLSDRPAANSLVSAALAKEVFHLLDRLGLRSG